MTRSHQRGGIGNKEASATRRHWRGGIGNKEASITRQSQRGGVGKEAEAGMWRRHGGVGI